MITNQSYGKSGTAAYSILPPDWAEFLRSPRPAVIFGAGRQATIVHDFCLMYKKPVFCLMTSGDRKRWGFLPREDKLPLYTAGEFPENKSKGDFDVVVAIAPAHNAEVINLLRQSGFLNITLIENWENTNTATRKAFYDDYFTRRGAKFSTDAEGHTYLECLIKPGVFRIYYDIDPIYNANLLGVLNNIVLPSVFDDFSCCSAVGAYEHGPVTMRPGDTVFAIGANIGVFSCAAAARGCIVHAFEPTPMVARKYLSKNASLYDTITVVPYAVLDECKKTKFYVNEDYTKSLNITRHSIFRDLEPEYTETVADAISLDSYVKENKIERVDFIRSFTEYSERYIFAGAMETLRRFAPVVSYYCYFASADYRIDVKNIFMEANPAYQFADNGIQSFAWVPGKRPGEKE